MKVAGTSARILLVEDSKPHRLMITSLLTRNPNLNVVESSLKLIGSKASGPSERFTIFNLLAHEITYLRADEAVDETNALKPVKYGKFLNK